MPSLFKMPFDDLEKTIEPVFAMWKSQRLAPDEALCACGQVSPNFLHLASNQDIFVSLGDIGKL